MKQVYVSEVHHEKLKRLALDRKTTITKLIAAILDYYLDKEAQNDAT